MKTKRIFFLIFLCLIFALNSGFVFASNIFTDNFDAYFTGNLSPQGGWEYANAPAQVGSSQYVSFPNSVGLGTQQIIRHSFIAQEEGTFGGKIRWGSTTEMNFYLRTGNETPDCHIAVDANNGDVFNDLHSYNLKILDIAPFNTNTWIEFKMRFRASDDKTQFCIGNDCSAWVECRYGGLQTFNTIDKLNFKGADSPFNTSIYIDDVYLSAEIADGPVVNITSPVIGSTITDLSTHLVGTYSGLDPNLYQSIHIGFTSGALGLSTTAKIISPIPAGGSGSFDVPLSDFGFQSNGTFTFRSNAVFRHTQLSDMLQTSDLTSPIGYNLILNVEGLSTPYSFESFDDWYSENAAGGYTYPSDFASSIVGFIQPIFEKAANFTNQSLLYFNASTSYSKGQELGLVFPTTQAYLDKINIFFGGFPLIQFFEFLVIVMLGIFTIRTIFKFIPFFG